MPLGMGGDSLAGLGILTEFYEWALKIRAQK